MSDTFTNEIYPVVARYAAMRFRDEESQALALVLAWWAWTLHQRQGGDVLPPSVWARVGVSRVLAGRDLPGEGIGAPATDVWEKLDRWQGAGMGKVIDRRAFPPDRILAGREALEALRAATDDTGRALIEMIGAEMLGTAAIAAQLGITPPAVSQRRRKLMQQAQE